MKNILKPFLLAIVLASFVSCAEDVDSNEPIPFPQVGGYNNSDEIAAANLVSKISFNKNETDSKGNLTGAIPTNISYESGKKDFAYRGATTGFIKYNTPSSKITDLSSITVSMWIKTSAHTGGAQSLYMIPRTNSWIGSSFILIEGTSTDKMPLKIHIESATSDKWIELVGDNALSGMFGEWKHLVYTYNGATSKFNVYVDGVDRTPAGLVDVKNGTSPFGNLAFTNVEKFIIGGYQQHLGTPYSNPDGWMLNYTGAMDEFRIYNSALSSTDVKDLFSLEKGGR